MSESGLCAENLLGLGLSHFSRAVYDQVFGMLVPHSVLFCVCVRKAVICYSTANLLGPGTFPKHRDLYQEVL
jgi:hypothetical protein